MPGATTLPEGRSVHARPPHLDVGMEFLTPKTVSAALDGEFICLDDCLDSAIEREEIKSYVDSNGNVQSRSVRTKKSIASLYKWIEAWLVYMMLLSKYHGYPVFYQMARYMSFIVNLAQKFKINNVLAYDVRHRQRLGQARSFEFTAIDNELYVVNFDASATKSPSKCQKCGGADHLFSECNAKKSGGKNRSNVDRNEICYMFQFKKCKWGPECYRRHACASCGGTDPQSACPNPKCKTAPLSAMVPSS